MTTNEIQQEIVEEFSLFENKNDKYNYIIELGKGLGSLEEQYKIDENLIKGCQSKLLFPQLAIAKSTIALLTNNIKAGNNAFSPVTPKDRTVYKGVACQTSCNSWKVLETILRVLLFDAIKLLNQTIMAV